MDLNHVIYAVPIVPEDVGTEKRIDWLTNNLNKFCVLPWLNMNTNPNGNVKLCCSIAMDYFVANKDRPFNLGYDDITQIWNGPHMQNVRNLHRQNNGSDDCLDCYKIEKLSGHSPRKGQNKIWVDRKNHDPELAEYLTEVSNEKLYSISNILPLSLELRLGNQCNLKCVTCWGMSSSLIHEERKDMVKSGELIKRDLGWLQEKWTEDIEAVEKADMTEWYETDIFYKNFRLMAPKLRRLYTTGGEPTLIKANYRMLEELLAAGNNTCRIEFTTNMTTWNPKFYENLSKFENVEIQMSVDGVGTVAEYIRYGTKWDVVRENIKKVFEMASTRPNWRIVCYSVLQALNYQHITEIWEVLDEESKRYYKRVDWWPITLNYPAYLSLAVIPIEQRLASLPRIRDIARRYSSGSNMFTLGTDALMALEDSISKAPYSEELSNRFKAYKKYLDSYRAQHG